MGVLGRNLVGNLFICFHFIQRPSPGWCSHCQVLHKKVPDQPGEVLLALESVLEGPSVTTFPATPDDLRPWKKRGEKEDVNRHGNVGLQAPIPASNSSNTVVLRLFLMHHLSGMTGETPNASGAALTQRESARRCNSGCSTVVLNASPVRNDRRDSHFKGLLTGSVVEPS